MTKNPFCILEISEVISHLPIRANILTRLAEPWWVEAIARHPILVPYTMGIKRLSNLYLDTSCVSRADLCHDFITKVKSFMP